jgi:hypothetical protein
MKKKINNFFVNFKIRKKQINFKKSFNLLMNYFLREFFTILKEQ